MPRLPESEEAADASRGWLGAAVRADLRLPALGAASWIGTLAAAALSGHDHLPAWVLVMAGVVGLMALAVVLRSPRWRATLLVTLLVAAVSGAGLLLRSTQAEGSPVAELGRDRAAVTLQGQVSSDVRRVETAYGPRWMLRLRVQQVTGRGHSYRLGAEVLVSGDQTWAEIPLGARVRLGARLGPGEGEEAAFAAARGAPEVLAGPDLWWRGAAHLRAAVRSAVAARPADQAALVPALVDGDDQAIRPDLAADFRTTGLTHLLAVSGTNLTLVVGFLLVVARWCRVRGRWLLLVGALGILGFVLLARTEPSVVRAAAMGTVGLIAMGSNGAQRALRALGLSVLGLLLVDPWLAVSAGFALSVLATAGILVFGPPWRDALARWLPRWCAEAIAVPAAAQLACLPVIAAISGQVSMVAVVANLLVQTVVGPATVLGLLGGLVALVWLGAAQRIGTFAGWCVAWVILVAERGAALPVAEIAWGSGPLALGLLTLLSLLLALAGPRVLRHPAGGILCAIAMVAVVTAPSAAWGPGSPSGAWPPADWALVACDVGQGDALVIRAGPDRAVVVDTGPEPDLLDRCLDELRIEQVPLVVLTHFHSDHVGGLDGLLGERPVGQILASPLEEPADGARRVHALADRAGVPLRAAAYGESGGVGEATYQVIGPVPGAVSLGQGESAANDASVVLLVEVAGVRMLLTGDVEPPAQAALGRATSGLQVDVVKVPHHGSRFQDAAWLAALEAEVAVVSVGGDNEYGHPAEPTLEALEGAGADVYRTDRDGAVAVLGRPRTAGVGTESGEGDEAGAIEVRVRDGPP
ncbi:ComEC/Rec2 family competence protein [Nocardioides insulae]|uniref:ComEC/Rec2 family competence protein n=1 Tax=Nocardioides insulae TaxID=394734 RepID=UPI0004076AC1|nr:ComEC/Rec2 family competence protein [Nocardioides insulae]